jgi:hypothetical protein
VCRPTSRGFFSVEAGANHIASCVAPSLQGIPTFVICAGQRFGAGLLIKCVWACSEDMKAKTMTERRGFMAKERAQQRHPNTRITPLPGNLMAKPDGGS